jgi:hypothetical protein
VGAADKLAAEDPDRKNLVNQFVTDILSQKCYYDTISIHQTYTVQKDSYLV